MTIETAPLTGLETLQDMVDGKRPPAPVARLLDMTLEGVDHGYARFRLPANRDHYNPHGSIHGGVLATLLDSAMGCAVHTTLKTDEAYTTLEIKVNYVRAATETSGILLCEGFVIHRGNRTATAEAKVVDAEGRLCAHGSTTCLIMARAG